MKKFSIAGANYKGKFIVTTVESNNKTNAVKKFCKEYGGTVYRVDEVK